MSAAPPPRVAARLASVFAIIARLPTAPAYRIHVEENPRPAVDWHDGIPVPPTRPRADMIPPRDTSGVPVPPPLDDGIYASASGNGVPLPPTGTWDFVGSEHNLRRRRRSRDGIYVEVPGSSWLDMNCHKQHSMPAPFVYGLMCSSPVDVTPQMGIFALASAVFVALSVAAKRNSARPGGIIHGYNRGRTHQLLSGRRRRLRDMLNDPVLVKDMERRYGDISSLRETVRQWEEDDFALTKKDSEDYIKVGGKAVVPWIRLANIWLSLVACITLYCSFGVLTAVTLIACLVHLIDNVLLHKTAVARSGGGTGRNKSGSRAGIVAVGVPVPEAEVGIPVGVDANADADIVGSQ